MKTYTLLIFMLASVLLKDQNIHFNVRGIIKNTEHAKYAYLSTISLQDSSSRTKIFMVSPILNGKFEFHGTFDLGGKEDYQQACLFVNERGNISEEELASKFKQFIWVMGREKNLRNIILEDIKLDIQERDQMRVSKIVEGGMLTKQLGEKSEAVMGGDRKLLAFVKTYPDSPISLNAVQEVAKFYELPMKNRVESMWGSPAELFALLSERLKNSKKGIELKKRISGIYNNK